jgi:hypothetical protein
VGKEDRLVELERRAFVEHQAQVATLEQKDCPELLEQRVFRGLLARLDIQERQDHKVLPVIPGQQVPPARREQRVFKAPQDPLVGLVTLDLSVELDQPEHVGLGDCLGLRVLLEQQVTKRIHINRCKRYF